MIAPCPFDNSSSVSGAGAVQGVPQHHSNHDPELLRRWGDERALELDAASATPVRGYDLAVPLYNSTTNCSGHASCNADIAEQPVNLTTLNTRYGDWAVDFLRRSAAGPDPFFLYVPTAHMHVPLAHLPQYRNASKGNSVFTDTLLEADTTLGRVMDAIRSDSRISDNTVVFVTSDNGPVSARLPSPASASAQPAEQPACLPPLSTRPSRPAARRSGTSSASSEAPRGDTWAHTRSSWAEEAPAR